MSPTALRYRLPGVVLTIIGVLLLVHTFSPQYAGTLVGLQFGPVFFPQLLLSGWLFLSVLSIFFIPEPLRRAMDEHRRHGKTVLLAILLLAYVVTLKSLGFLLGTFLLCLAAQWIVAGRVWARPILWAAALTLSGWVCFEFVVGVPLPRITLF